MATRHSSYRISEEGKQLVKLLSKRLGINDTSILELAIRKLAKAEGVKIMTNEEMRQETLEVVQLSEKAPTSNPSASARWGSSQDGSEMVTFQEVDGWYGYQRGIKDGLYSEGEDQGPFKTREAAKAELLAQYKESQEPADENIYPDDL